MRTVEDIRNEWVDAVGQEAERFGFPRIAAELKTLLMLTPGPMSLTEMAERLEVSKASISTNIRILERWRLVRKLYRRGERGNFYETRGHMWEAGAEIASTIIKDMLGESRILAARSLAETETVEVQTPEEEQEVELLRATFAETLKYLDAIEHILDLFLQRGEITPAVLKKVTIA